MRCQRLLRAAAQVAVRAYPFYSGGFRIANSYPLRKLVGAGQVETRLSCGARLRVRLDDMDGRTAYLLGDQDRKLSAIFRKVLRPGDVVLDIGANWGIMSLQFATLVGANGKVHAFEPQSELANSLVRSAALNDFHQLVVHPFGLSTEARTAELVMLPSFSGIASLHGLPRWASAAQAITLPVTLKNASDYLEGLGIAQLRMVKMDVEGHEPEVLKGAERFLDRVRPDVILFEHNSGARGDERSAAMPFWSDPGVRWLVERDYQLGAVKPKTLIQTTLTRLNSGDATCGAENFIALAPGMSGQTLQRTLFH